MNHSNEKKTMIFVCCTLPETNGLLLKIDGWKMNFFLGPGNFSGTMLVSGSVSLKVFQQLYNFLLDVFPKTDRIKV